MSTIKINISELLMRTGLCVRKNNSRQQVNCSSLKSKIAASSMLETSALWTIRIPFSYSNMFPTSDLTLEFSHPSASNAMRERTGHRG